MDDVISRVFSILHWKKFGMRYNMSTWKKDGMEVLMHGRYKTQEYLVRRTEHYVHDSRFGRRY